MKLIIASLLVVSVVAMASVAQAGLYKSIKECSDYFGSTAACRNCCKAFDHVGVEGRHSMLPFSGSHVCKCITKAKHEEEHAKWNAQWEKEQSEPLYKSVKQCSQYTGSSAACRNCCKAFDQVGVEGRHSLMPLSDHHVCKCISKAKSEEKHAKWNAQWEREQRAKGYL